MSYVLDTNVFIEANNRYYGLDFCPHFWKWIKKHHRLGRVCSIRPVYDELKGFGDNLADWVKSYDECFHDIMSEACQKNFSIIADYCVNNYDMDYKKNLNFLDSADPWLLAKAMTDGSTIVTEEKYSEQAKKILIPNLCRTFNIEYRTYAKLEK